MTDGFVIQEEDYLAHYGIQRRSGRYPWGSGEDEVTRSKDFLSIVAEKRKEGMTDPEIAKSFGTEDRPFTTTMLRATTTIARNQKRSSDIAMVAKLHDKGMSNGAIAERLGLAGESSVRALLDPTLATRTNELQDIAAMLKDQVERKGYVDVGVGVERYADATRTKFDTALSMLESEGYPTVKIQIDQVGTGQNKTTTKVLAMPDKTAKEHYISLKLDDSQIKTLDVMKVGDKDYVPVPPVLSIDSKRVGINYSKTNAKGEEIGGGTADGVIYVRPGVDDVSMGGAHYAQVRIAVDGTHYIKGMAVYKKDLPDGVDLVFNTNKSDTGNKLDALKPMKDDPEDPFGAAIKPGSILLKADGSRKSAMNIVNEEGDWNDWSRNLATQMLSKQKPSLAKEQLDVTYAKKKAEFDEIMALTNPTVRRQLLQSYADDVDSSAVHLKAAAMPRQASQVIMPIRSMKDTEVYAPQFRDGERVALVRYPHGGVFEIPELTVNNRNREAIDTLGKAAKDAIGINHKVAERLSGADFDGDTVLVIPNNAGKIKSKPALEALKGFDPKKEYGPYDGMKTIDSGVYNEATKKVEYGPKGPSKRPKQTQMGNVSNLITDMTIKGANDSEIARAVRHSMVVIDAEKHHLDYARSAKDNGIKALKVKYQESVDADGSKKTGASTLISRTSRQTEVLDRKRNFKIDEKTGEKLYTYTGEGYTNAAGKFIAKKTKSVEGAETKDANDLSSGQPIEKIYATHANKLKSLANQARLAEVRTKNIPYSESAAKVYAPEVSRLNAALNVALKNAPLERQAQLVANARIKLKKDAHPEMDDADLKKLSGKELTLARVRVGANKTLVDISDREWEAIQAGAITNHKLTQILKNSKLERVKELATPREKTVMSGSKQTQARQLISAGRTPSEVADILGVSLSTLTSSLAADDE